MPVLGAGSAGALNKAAGGAMFTSRNHAVALAVLIPALLVAAAGHAEPTSLSHARSADHRTVARFVEAVYDYTAFGRTGPIFTPEVAEILRFRLRFTHWLYRYNALEAMGDRALQTHSQQGPGPSILSALPQLPSEVEYRLHGNTLLLIDRRTRQVIDVLDHALGR
jgi:hypothetical protein